MNLIMYMATPDGMTGAPRRALTLAKTLQERGINVCIASQRESQLLEEAHKAGIETIAIEPVGVLSLRQGVLFRAGLILKLRIILALTVQNFRFGLAVRKFGADAIWVRGSKGIAFVGIGALLTRRPLVWDVDYEPESIGVVRKLHRLGLWISAAIVFQYKEAGAKIFGPSLASRYRHCFRTIIPGVDFSSLKNLETSKKYAFPEVRDFFIVTQVGSICKRKNQLHTINLLRQIELSSLRNSVRVRFVGEIFDEEYHRLLQKAVKAAGLCEVVEFAGWRDDVHQWIAESDLLLMPSLDEGVPNVVQEAMYLGIPVMGSFAGGMPDIIKHQVNGWLLPLEDLDAWSSQLVALLENPELCKEIGKRASKSARNEFGVQAWGEAYAEVLGNIATPRII